MDDQAFKLLMNKIEEQDMKFKEMDEKLDELLAWKWKLAGATLVMSTIGGLVVQLFLHKLGG